MATGGHLSTSVAETLVVLQGLFDGERRLAFAFEIVWVVFLSFVSKALGKENQ